MQDVLRYDVLRRLINNLLQAVYSQIPNFLFKPIDVHTTNQLMFKTQVAPHWLRAYNKKQTGKTHWQVSNLVTIFFLEKILY